MSKQASSRLAKLKDTLTMSKTATTIPFDPDCTEFPTRKQLPKIEGAPDQAAWVWGKDDYLGRLNLLTPTRVAAASKEIRTGEIVPVNLPLNHPEQPAFGRKKFEHEIITLAPGIAYDDAYKLNTQSGTQWDGFRHHAKISTSTFYNGTKGEDITGPNQDKNKCSIHHWAEHGIAGRGVLLDVRRYAHSQKIEYDPMTSYAITYDMLRETGKSQGIDIRPEAQGGDIKVGDMLFVRGGWGESYWAMSSEERIAIGSRQHAPGKNDPTRFAGVDQSEEILDWLHDCWFATLAGDAPGFERWPTQQKYYLHEYILALWGMPLGEMLDLEKLALRCHEQRKWTFFFTSSPANVPGGVASHVNGMAIL